MDDQTYPCIKFLWELYLGFRQKQVYRTTQRDSLPEEVQQIIDDEAFARARAYSSDKVDFLIFKALYGAVLNAGLTFYGGVQLFWEKSEDLVGWAGVASSETLTGCVFVLIMNAFNTLAYLPLELYVNFLLEQKHGFNRLSAGFFATDRLKVYLFSQLAALFLTFVAVNIVISGGEYFYIYLWLFLVVIFVFINGVYPDFIAPIFDTFSPLPAGDLRTKVQTLTERVGYPIERVYILESSRRTEHSDAYHVGLYKSKRIVFSDSLLQGHRGHGNRGLNNDEVLAVVGHELGHWNFNHILEMSSLSLLMCLVVLVVYGPSLKEKLLEKNYSGLVDVHSVLGLCFVLGRLLPTRVAFFGFGLLWLSRCYESQADGFAGSLGLASHLRRALIKVHRDNLLFPVHDWLYSMSYYNHPSLLDRLRYLDKFN